MHARLDALIFFFLGGSGAGNGFLSWQLLLLYLAPILFSFWVPLARRKILRCDRGGSGGGDKALDGGFDPSSLPPTRLLAC